MLDLLPQLLYFHSELMMKIMEEANAKSNLFFLLLALLPLVYFILKFIKSPTLPPGPFSWPIIGNLLSIGNKPHASLAQLAHVDGPIISVCLGTRLVVVGSSPSVAMEILKIHDRVMSARYIPNASYAKKLTHTKFSLGWADCTDQWKYLRSICHSELFSNTAIESQSKLRETKVIELVEYLGTQYGQLVRIDEVVFDTVINMLSNTLVSQDFVNMKKRDSEEGLRGLVRRFLWLISPNLADLYPILEIFGIKGPNKESNGLFFKMCDMWGVVIKERRGGKGSEVSIRRREFLDFPLANGFTDDQIDYLLLELITAGADTTTSTVEWAMAELIRNEEAMKRVCIELEREINTHMIRESDLLRLRYLHACVKETLRLHPPAPLLLPHRALETCKIMNYTVPKDALVLVNVWAIGRDPTVWDDPLAFKPERFLDSNRLDNFHDFGFLPFGAGRRICPGLPMASKQVTLILASLINYFEWSLPQGMDPFGLDMEEEPSLTLQKKRPLVLTPRVKTWSVGVQLWFACICCVHWSKPLLLCYSRNSSWPGKPAWFPAWEGRKDSYAPPL